MSISAPGIEVMIYKLGTLLVTFLITNWIYNELVLLYPPVDSFTKEMYRTVRIPTHDRWGDLTDSRLAARVDRNVRAGLREVSPSAPVRYFQIFDQRVRDLWNSGSVSALFGEETRPFLRGEEIFITRS